MGIANYFPKNKVLFCLVFRFDFHIVSNSVEHKSFVIRFKAGQKVGQNQYCGFNRLLYLLISDKGIKCAHLFGRLLHTSYTTFSFIFIYFFDFSL